MPNLMSIWVKAPLLKGRTLVIVSKCLKWVNPKLYNELAKKRVVLEHCPEQEGQVSYGKIASIIRSSNPSKLIIATIDGSPHCFTLHAAINEAVYIVGEKIDREHYVILDGEELVKISPESIRIARYLSHVEKLLRNNKWILNELKKHSKEYLKALEIGDAEIKNP